MKTILHTTRTAACLALLMFLASAARADQTTITTPFRGVRVIHRATDAPRKLDMHLVEIDLADPAIRFKVTPANGPDVPGETTMMTTRKFLERTGAQLAVNCTFFAFDPQFPYVDNLGLVASEGETVSPVTPKWPTLLIGRDNSATIVEGDSTATVTAALPSALWNAVSGNERILRAGRVVARDGALHPRTAAGLTADRKLLLLIVDGRNPNHSQGMTTPEVAGVLLGHGAVEAINLDGGGSSTLAVADPAPRVFNVPVGIKNIPGTERPVGVSLAVYAAPAVP